MNTNNIKISTKLLLGFSAIILFVAGMSALTFWQANRLWQTTHELYTHPLQVARTTRDIKADVLIMHRAMKDLVNAENSAEIQEALNEYNKYEIKAYKSFDILYMRYLVPKKDLDRTLSAFNDWKAITDETKRLKLEGLDDLAKIRTVKNGVGGKQVTKIITKIDVVIDFSSQKGESFYTDALESRNWIANRIILAFILIIGSTLFIAYYLIRSIRNPLKQMTLATASYSQGNYNSRAEYVSTNEIGQLSASLNKMAEFVQKTIDIQNKESHIANALLKDNDLRNFSNHLLTSLIEETNSQIAAIYFLDPYKSEFTPYESIGISKENLYPFSSTIKEGVFGLAIAKKKIVHLTTIPENSLFTFRTIVGTYNPESIITIPVFERDDVVAIISLASLNPYSETIIELLNSINMTLSERLNGVLSYQKIIEFSGKLDAQNRELEAQSKELVTQADELKEYNIELELQKKQLNDANQLKSSFLSNMSHELRTPLNSVIALSGVLNRKLSDKIPEEEFKYLNIIERNGKNLLALINDILDISRIESGHDEVIYSPVSIYDIVCNTIENQEPIINEKNISVTNLISSTLPRIISDSNKIHHILQNVIGNAIKFTENGSVTISAFEENDNILISVEDTGIGISATQIPHIFDEFRQADDRTSRKFGGTGLGLAIAKKHTIMLEGSIDVNSKPGVGSVFTLKFPKKPNKENFIEQEIHQFVNTLSSTNNFQHIAPDTISILVVEDSEPAIIQLKDILEETGYTITVARNGKEALDILNVTSFDAMILDLMMPEIDGFEVLKKIRQQEKTDLLPVLILSAKHITKDELSFLKGNNIYQLIQKGDINKSELLTSIRNMTNSKHSSKTAPLIRKGKGTNGKGKPKILLIDEIHDNHITVQAILGDEYELIGVSSGVEGIHSAKSFNPSLILLDISLPGIDGFNVFNALRSDPAIKQTPIIAYTANAMKGDREKLIDFGFDDYISKPVDEQLFHKTLNKWLNGE